MNRLFNDVNRRDLQPGDHVYVWRSGFVYSHHGIYVGDNNVVHFRSALSTIIFCHRTRCPYCPNPRENEGMVAMTCLNCFLHGGIPRLFRYGVDPVDFTLQFRGTCTMPPSDDAHIVIHRAMYLLQHGSFGNYNFFRNNCENFSLYCKTGLVVNIGRGFRSGQAAAVRAQLHRGPLAMGIASFAMFGLSGLGLSAFAASAYYRLAEDIGNRPDATVVQVEDLVERLRLEHLRAS